MEGLNQLGNVLSIKVIAWQISVDSEKPADQDPHCLLLC